MSDFERELARIRQQKEDVERQVREADRFEHVRLDQERRDNLRRSELQQEEEIRRYVTPVKDEITRRLQVLGDQTWGHSNFGQSLEIPNQTSSLSPELDPYHVIAVWTVGRTKRFHAPNWRDKNTGVWHATLELGKNWLRTEYYAVELVKRDNNFHFELGRYVSQGHSVKELEEILLKQFQVGPTIKTPGHPYGGGYTQGSG